MFMATHLVGFGTYSQGIVEIPLGSGTAIGTLTAVGGLAASFDGVVNADAASSSSGAGVTASYVWHVGKNWGVNRLVKRFIAYSPSDSPFIGAGTTGWKFQGSTDNFSGSVVDLLTGTTAASSAQILDSDVLGGLDISTAYGYHRFNLLGNGANSTRVAELRMFE